MASQNLPAASLLFIFLGQRYSIHIIRNNHPDLLSRKIFCLRRAACLLSLQALPNRGAKADPLNGRRADHLFGHAGPRDKQDPLNGPAGASTQQANTARNRPLAGTWCSAGGALPPFKGSPKAPLPGQPNFEQAPAAV